MRSLAARWLLASAALASLVGCATPDKPVRATLYDFGPSLTPLPVSAQTLPPLVLADIEASGALDGASVMYRLGYADANQLRPYAHARWSATPPRLVRQRLREQLSRERPVLDVDEGAALARGSGAMPRVLRLELEEFSHFFETQTQSWGLLRLRATLMESTPAGEKLLAQRSLVVRQPAPSVDAPGGVRALAAATDAAADEIGRWLLQTR
jgi:cholesterol transport system auxiliary component